MDFILQYIDALWLPLAWFVVHRQQRWWALGFVASCMVMMRMQAELMHGIGYPHGILTFMNSDMLSRGILIYSIFYMLYFALAVFSPGTKGSILLATSIGIFFMAFFVSSMVMLL